MRALNNTEKGTLADLLTPLKTFLGHAKPGTAVWLRLVLFEEALIVLQDRINKLRRHGFSARTRRAAAPETGAPAEVEAPAKGADSAQETAAEAAAPPISEAAIPAEAAAPSKRAAPIEETAGE